MALKKSFHGTPGNDDDSSDNDAHLLVGMKRSDNEEEGEEIEQHEAVHDKAAPRVAHVIKRRRKGIIFCRHGCGYVCKWVFCGVCFSCLSNLCVFPASNSLHQKGDEWRPIVVCEIRFGCQQCAPSAATNKCVV
jgi:hypothetical protein